MLLRASAALPAASWDAAVGPFWVRCVVIAAGSAPAAAAAAAAAIQELCRVPGCVAPVGQRAALALAAQVVQGPGSGLCLVPAGPAASARINALLLQLDGRCRRAHVWRVLCSRQLPEAAEAVGRVRQTQTSRQRLRCCWQGTEQMPLWPVRPGKTDRQGRHHPPGVTAHAHSSTHRLSSVYRRQPDSASRCRAAATRQSRPRTAACWPARTRHRIIAWRSTRRRPNAAAASSC